MTPCHLVEIETPKKVRLNGLWFGTKKPKRVIVFVHGLTSSAFSRQPLVTALATGDTAVLTFNNRGHDIVTFVKKGKKSFLGGSAHEVFEESVDDIDGAVACARGAGATLVYLVGHSTGCQKAIYWAAKRKGKGVSGIVLLAPLADVASLSDDERALLPRAQEAARALVQAGAPHTLLPAGLWPMPCDAQRLLSLCTPESVEQSIFPYFDASRTPRLLRSVTTPLLVLLAGKDEYADRPAGAIASWFQNSIRSPFNVAIMDGVDHGFRGGEQEVTDAIKKWMKSL